MKASDLYGSPFLKGSDLQRPVKLTISDLEIGEFTDQKSGAVQKRVIMAFAGAKKRLVLNKTHANALLAAYGDEMGEWPGKSVILAPGLAPNGQATVQLSAVPVEPEEDAGAGNPF